MVICRNISFVEIAHFIQKNFSMSGTEAEVIALRLRNTFDEFSLSAHPTYFAGIPRETLSALLQANRRAELIQLAVDGFLTFIVADDSSDVNLSRTTRSRFLRKLAVSLNLEKRSYAQSELIEFTKAFSGYHDFDIDPLEFIQGFINKGILHFENDSVRFSLPFIASYLLALELKDDDALAVRYFQTADDDFDLTTFDIYAELGASPNVTAQILADLESCRNNYDTPEDKHIFLTEKLRPVLLGRPGRVEALQKRLKEAVQDVQSNRDDAKQKQRILDIADKIREDAAQQSEIASSKENKGKNEALERMGHSIGVWAIAAILLGSGAEHLDAATKQKLAKTLVELATHIMHEWTSAHANVDFAKIKEKLTSPEILATFPKMNAKESEQEATRLVGGLVDVLEYSFLGEPFRRMIHHLCEQARHKVLASSVEKAKVEGRVENVIYATWLADIDSKRGSELLSAAIKHLPPAPFFRFS
jgi:hypothetical protein